MRRALKVGRVVAPDYPRPPAGRRRSSCRCWNMALMTDRLPPGPEDLEKQPFDAIVSMAEKVVRDTSSPTSHRDEF